MPSWRTPKEVRAWAAGLRDGEKHVTAAAMVYWAAAGDVLFDRSQEYVHILSGNLKASGRQRTFKTPQGVTFEVVYGGGEVDYAIYEIARGGDHDFLGRAVEVSTRIFDQAMVKIFDDAMERSRG